MRGSEHNSWIIAAAYFSVAAVALYTSRARSARPERTFWTVAAVLLLAFGLAKQLRIQGELTDWIRTDARAHHLYDHRKLAEYPFVAIVIGAALFIGFRFRYRLVRCGPDIAITSLALLMLTAFLLIRATSVHAIDPFMYKTVLGLRSGWWAEIGFLLLIAGGAVWAVERREGPPPNG